MTLRDYQIRALAAVDATGARSVCLVSGTGSGKTILGATWITAGQSRGLWVVHRIELLTQSAGQIARLIGERNVGIITPGYPASPYARVQVATVQTLLARDARPPAERIVCDEAHHFKAKTWETVIAAYPDAQILGLSVDASSRIEMRGGPFGLGFIGPISEAFDMAKTQWSTETLNEIERIVLVGVESRGWTGNTFAWKRCRAIIRHSHIAPLCRVTAQGMTIDLTDTHSVYSVTGNKGGAPSISCKLAASIKHGDTLLGDDGNGWSSGAATKSTSLVDSYERSHIACDVTSIDRLNLREIGMNPRQIHAARTRGSLPKREYLALGNAAPSSLGIRIEGSKGIRRTTVDLHKHAYVLGYWLGNGWFDESSFCLSVNIRVLEKVRTALNALACDLCATIRDRASSTTPFVVELKLRSALFVSAIRSLLTEPIAAYTKHIPAEWLLTWDGQQRRQLLAGLLDSDGHLASTPRRSGWYFVTTSQNLSIDVQTLLRSLGVPSGSSKRNIAPGGKIRGRQVNGLRPSFSVYFSDYALSSNNDGHYGVRTRFDHSRHAFLERKVKSTELLPAPSSPVLVYDLEMEGHPSFVANGVLVHNTATPERQDGQPLGDIFERLVVAAHYGELIDAGHLVQCRAFVPPVGLNRGLALHPVEAYRKHAEGSLAFVFVSRIAAAVRLAGEFTADGIPAAAVHQNTSKRERRESLERFAAGDLRVLTSVNALTEGIDIPAARCAILAKPFAHAGNFLQAAGRILRPSPGKPDAILIDLVGAVLQHGLPTEDRVYSLDGVAIRRASPSLRQCPACGFVMAGSPTTCQQCGFDLSSIRPPDTGPRIYSLELREVFAGSGTPQDAKHREYGRLIALARARKYDLAFVAREYKKLFRELPPWLAELPERSRRWQYDRFVARGRELGFRPGYAPAMYRETFSVWPPSAWRRSEVAT